MKLKLKSLILWQIENAKEPNTDLFNRTINIIRDLEKLYNLNALSEEELKGLIAKYYTLTGFTTEKEINKKAKSILRSNDIAYGIVHIKILTTTYHDCERYLTAYVYYRKDSSFYHVFTFYTLYELKQLIKERKIVIDHYFIEKYKFVYEETKNTIELANEYNIPSISEINETDFEGYGDVILPLIKKRLQKSKVNRDIMRIINSLRKKLEQYYQMLSTIRQPITKSAPSIQVQEYYDCLNILNTLDKELQSNKGR